LAALLLALAVGFWPAFVLSGFARFVLLARRRAAMRAGPQRPVTLQFSILVTLAIAGRDVAATRFRGARSA